MNVIFFPFRTYSDYESVNECMEGVCKIYEEHLKRQNPNIPSITYDIAQVCPFFPPLYCKTSSMTFTFIDRLDYRPYELG